MQEVDQSICQVKTAANNTSLDGVKHSYEREWDESKSGVIEALNGDCSCHGYDKDVNKFANNTIILKSFQGVE